MALGSRVLVFGSAVLGLCALVLLARGFWPFTVDDTFISLRYAKHLAEGLGPTWNPGGPRVEGYTTALWTAVLALPHALGFDALRFAKASGVALMFAAFGLAGLFAYELGRTLEPRARALAAALPFALLAGYWPLALHAISGMETALAGLLLTAFALVCVRLVRMPTARRARSLALLALACMLTRPEALSFCAAAFVLLPFLLAPDARRTVLAHIALYCVLPGALYFVARYAYFGLLFPLSFYVKATGQARFAGLSEVELFFEPFVVRRPYLALLAVVGAFRVRALYPVLLGLLAFTLFFIFPAHIMGFESRYLMPLVPLFAALFGLGTARLASPVLAWLAARAPRWAGLAQLALLSAAWALAALPRFPAHEASARTRFLDYGAGLSRAHIALADTLRAARLAVVRPTIALLDVGALAYYSEWFAIDTFGLNDARVALSRRADRAYVFAQQPELLVVVSQVGERYEPVFEWEAPLYADALARGYSEVATYEFLPDYHLLVLARAGSPMRKLFAQRAPQCCRASLP